MFALELQSLALYVAVAAVVFISFYLWGRSAYKSAPTFSPLSLRECFGGIVSAAVIFAGSSGLAWVEAQLIDKPATSVEFLVVVALNNISWFAGFVCAFYVVDRKTVTANVS